jgi:hypothetical protein
LFLKALLPDYEVVYAQSDQNRLDEIAVLDEIGDKLLAQGFRPEAMTPERRENLRRAFETGRLKKVIANDVWSTGVSFERLQVMVRADARSNEIVDEQIPGRVSRIHVASGKSTGIVEDFLDQFDPSGLGRQAQNRKKNYEAKGWTQNLPQPAPR